MICSHFDRRQFFFRTKSNHMNQINREFKLTHAPLENSDLLIRTPTKQRKQQFTVTKQFYPTNGYKSISPQHSHKVHSKQKYPFTPNKTKNQLNFQINNKKLFFQLKGFNRQHWRQIMMQTRLSKLKRHISCKNHQLLQNDSSFSENLSLIKKQKTQKKFRVTQFKQNINISPKNQNPIKQNYKVQGWDTPFDQYFPQQELNQLYGSHK